MTTKSTSTDRDWSTQGLSRNRLSVTGKRSQASLSPCPVQFLQALPLYVKSGEEGCVPSQWLSQHLQCGVTCEVRSEGSSKVSRNLMLSQLWREHPPTPRKQEETPWGGQPICPETCVWDPAKASLDLV